MSRPKLLIASPDESFCAQLRQKFESDFDVMLSTHLSSVLPILIDEQIDLFIADQRWELGDGAVIDRVLCFLKQNRPHIPSIVLVGRDTPPLLKSHAQRDMVELVPGPISIDLVSEAMDRAFSSQSSEDAEQAETTVQKESAARSQGTAVAEPHVSASEAAKSGAVVYPGVTRNFETRSPDMKEMLEDLMVAASHDVTILLIGETGAGKTFLSNLVHEASPRRDEPFIHLACGAMSKDLIDSELFGHVKGAFTSASNDKDGKFLAAGRGTILLDEIDVLVPEQQVKLLRVIETGEFEPVGSNQTYKSQARLVVASNLDLEPLVEQGKFRPDLYYRLNMMKFELLPLRKRKMDIIPLCKKFIQKFQEKHGIQIHRIDDSLLEAVLSYPWPGNVRELENVMRRAVIYCKDGVLTREHLPSNILKGHVGPTNDPSIRLGNMDAKPDDHSLEQQVALSEKEIIEQALYKNNFSRTNTAKELGISRVTLYNKMKKYDMMK